MLDEYFKNLDRSAIVITPRQPFFDWLRLQDPHIVIDEEVKQGEIFLLPDYETREEMVKWLKKNYDEIFSELLNEWYMDDTMWPENRTFEMFEEWFSYSMHTMIFDTQKGKIEKI